MGDVTKTLTVYYPRPIPKPALARLREMLAASVRLLTGAAAPEPAAWEVLVEGRPAEALLAASERLRHLVVPYAGVPQRTWEFLAARPDVFVHNLHHNAAPTAEMALALLLAAAKRVVPCDRSLRRGDWRARYNDDDDTPLLAGRRALLLGYGWIGQRLARALAALEVTVDAVRLRASEATLDKATGATVHPPQALDALLPRGQLVLIALPATTATEGLLDAARLNRLPAGAVLVNVGRATIIEEAALYEALRNGPLGAAGLDVWYRYPTDEAERAATMPSEFPFHELDNVVMSPHRAGHGEATERLRAEHLAALLNKLAAGDTDANRVDLEVGY